MDPSSAPKRRHEAGAGNPTDTPLFERKHEMGDVNGATDRVTNANPPPRNPDTVSCKEANKFKERMDGSTTSNDGSKQSQGTSNSCPIILARRPPINLGNQIGQQVAPLRAGVAPAPAANAPAATTQTVPGTSTPLPKDAAIDPKTKEATLQSGDFTVKVKPDKKLDAGAEQVADDLERGADLEFPNRPKPDGAVTKHQIDLSLHVERKDGKVTSVTITKELHIQTVYGSKADPNAPSAYGRGHIKKDRDAGNNSLRFHEGNHGQDFIDYVKTHPYPTFKIDKPITEEEYEKRLSEFKKQIAQYDKDMQAQTEEHTDRVTDPPAATTPAPAK
jgi:hypothetical protein